MPSTSTTARRRRTKAQRATTTASPSSSESRSPTPRQGNANTTATTTHNNSSGGGGDVWRTYSTSPSSKSPLLFSAEELQQTPDSCLLSYLMNAYNAVRTISIRPLLSSMPLPSLAVATAAAATAPSSCPLVSPFTSAFVEELLTPRLLCSAIPDVSQMVACLLCDAVRLHHQQQLQRQTQHDLSAASDSTGSPSDTSGGTAQPPSPRSMQASPQTIESDVAAGVAPLPFLPTRCVDVLHCITHVFADLFPSSPSSSSSSAVSPALAPPLPLKRVAHLVERAAVSHIFRYLIPHCPLASAETQRALQNVFDAVRCATMTTSGGGGGSSISDPANTTAAAPSGMPASSVGGLKTAGSNASVATCNEMAQLLTDILVVTRDINAAQLKPLLEELAGASSALRRSTVKNSPSPTLSLSSITGGRRGGGHLRTPQLQGGALIAARVLLEQTDVALQPAIAAWAVGDFDEGVAELLAADVIREEKEEEDEEEERDNDGGLGAVLNGVNEGEEQRTRGSRVPTSLKNSEAQLSWRSRGLRKVAHVLEVLVALTELSVDLIDQVLPVLAPHLEHPNADLRLLLVRGFGAVFAAHDAAVATYTAIFTGPFLSRFFDVKPTVRTEMLRVSAMLVAQCVTRPSSGGDANSSTFASDEGEDGVAQQERLWVAFQPCWDRLLTDLHVLVRKQAVTSITEAALVAPRLFLRRSSRHQANNDRGGATASLERPPLSPASGSTAATAAAAASPALSTSPSAFLLQSLGLRARDKNRRVRDVAVDGLTRLYRAYRLPWIPNAVLDAVRVEAGDVAATTAATTLPEVVVENLLPAPVVAAAPSLLLSGTSGVGGRQSTLTRWMDATTFSCTPASSSVPVTRAVGCRPHLAPDDFVQTDDYDTPRVKAEETEDDGDALLGLRSAAVPATNQNGPCTDEVLRQCTGGAVHGRPSQTTAFVDGLLGLCRSVDAPHFAQLLHLAEKKPQLRLAIQKLFEYQAAVKASNGDVKSSEGQQRINAIHRLLSFLQGTTVAQKGEWDALFRAKDDTVRKALLRACASTHLDWLDVREVLLRSLRGRVGPNEFAFVEHMLVPQILLPTTPDHVRELVRRLHRSIYVSDHAEVVVDTPEAVAVLRALLFLTAGAPAYGALTAAGLAEALQAAAQQSTAPPPIWCALLLQALQQWASSFSGTTTTVTPPQPTGKAEEAASVPTLTAGQREAMVRALRAMALACLPMQQVADRPAVARTSKNRSGVPTSGAARTTSPLSSSLTSLKQLAKQATRTLLALLQVPELEKSAADALQSLAAELTHQLTSGRALTNDVKTVAWLASVQAVSTHPQASALLRQADSLTAEASEASLPALLPHLRTLLLAAVGDVSDTAEHAKLSSFFHRSASVRAGSEAVSVALPTASPTMSIAAAIVDGAAKTITRLALSCPAAGGARTTAIAHALDSFLQAYKAVATLACGRAGALSLGSCRRRLAVEKQLVKLLAAPTSDIAKEMAASVVLSVEEEASVREVVQNKLAALLLQRSCDMRVAALLLLTAISEDTKSSFQRLRCLVESVGDHLRQKQASQGVSLSSSAALYCYWEYTIPFLVLFLAHHPYYTTEAEMQFVSFQRVWHLLVGELFRHGTQCAGFVVELLSKIKQSDDALDPSSNATRVMCDLGSRVLLECLGQRQCRAEDLRRYPGAILLPSFFVKTSQPSPQRLLETVYLSDEVRVAPNAPFRLTSAATANNVGGGGGSRGSSSSRPVTPPASSLTAFNAPTTSGNDQQKRGTPSTQRKRSRSPSFEVAVREDDSPAVSLSPSLSPHDLHQGKAVAATNAATAAAAAAALRSSQSPSPSSQRERTEPALADSSDTPLPEQTCEGSNADTFLAVTEGSEGAKREARQKAAVDGALKELFTGLTKSQIAQLRWKVVRARLEDAVHEAETAAAAAHPQRHPQQHQASAEKPLQGKSSAPAVVSESELEALLQYAKDALRVWYNNAPA